MKISAAVLITAMICVPVTATVVGNDSYTLNVAGSTTVQPLMVQFQKEFERFANVEMNVTGGGSGVGISSTLNGVAHIGMLSRDLKESETGLGLEVHVIAKDAVVVIVNKEAGLPVDPLTGMPNLSLKDIADIYSGKITDWGEAGGNRGQSIAVNAREEGSGTRDCFEAAMVSVNPDFKMKERDVNSVNSTGAIIAAISTIPGAIGYINLNISVDAYPSIMKVTVNNIEAKAASIYRGAYALSRDLIVVTNGEPTGMVGFFIEWMLSKDGQDIVEDAGLIRVDGRVII
jgi:phosphate transport system substrate-binding protein